MKKVVFILSGIALLLGSCGKEAKMNKLEGKWASTEIRETYTDSDGDSENSSYSYSSTLEFTAENTYTWDEWGQEGTYDVTSDGKTLVLTESNEWGTDTQSWTIEKLKKKTLILSVEEEDDGDTYKGEIEFSKI